MSQNIFQKETINISKRNENPKIRNQQSIRSPEDSEIIKNI
jgi:hypothetical protein